MFDLDILELNYTENYYCPRYIPPISTTSQEGAGGGGDGQQLYDDSSLTATTSGESDVELFELVVKGYLITIVATFGLLGNVISAIILTKMKTTSLNQLLLGLTCCDMILIICTIFLMGLDCICEYYGLRVYTDLLIPHAMPYIYPIGTTAQTGSIYFTIVVTIERWLAVSYPLRAKSICTLSRARLSSTAILTFAVIYNIPKWFEYRTGKFGTYYDILMTKLRCNGTYITVYINWSNLFVIYLFPIGALILLNTVIYLQIRRTNATRQILTKNQSNELSLAAMLVAIVSVYIFCNILPFVNNFMESTTGDPRQELVDLSNLLVTFNSSVNCIIYCALGVKFRKHFLLLVNCQHPRRSLLSTSNKSKRSLLTTPASTPAGNLRNTGTFQQLVKDNQERRESGGVCSGVGRPIRRQLPRQETEQTSLRFTFNGGGGQPLIQNKANNVSIV